MKQHNKRSDKTSFSPIKHIWILLTALLLAMAVAVTCVLCFSDKDHSVTPGSAADANVSTSATLANRTGNLVGVLNNGDILTYAYNGSYYAVTLPQGTYKLEVWGGQGGGPNSSAYGGKGGYTYGQIYFTDTTTVYVYPGGAGGYGSGARTGAYNGGGRITAGHPGGGGGGASHIATAVGLLTSLGAGNNNILIVAGGGGGTGCGCAYNNAQPGSGGGGHASGTSAPSNHHSTNRGGGYGGSVSGGGSRGAGNGSNAGTFGKGGDQTSAGGGSGGGAGGGGYYGGGSGGADYPNYNDNDDGPGGGGSGYVNTSRITAGTYGGTTGANYNASSSSAPGRAQITAINVNQSPAEIPATITGRARATQGATTISPDNIATDPDTTKTTLYFTDGTAGAYDTFTATANTKLWLDRACTKLATNYIDWTWTNSRTLSINNFKLYPRNGVDGCTQNGRLTLYTKVRDSFGSGTGTRGCSVIMFHVTVPANVATLRERVVVNTTVIDPVLHTPLNERYFVGTSTTAAVPDGPVEEGTIFNPTHTASAPRYTAVLEKSLRVDTPFTIRAADLLGGIINADQVVMAIDSTIAITGSTRSFLVEEYDNASSTHRVTAYNSNKVLISNTFDQLTFVCKKPDPTFQVFPVTLYVVEKTTAYGSATPNVVPGIAPVHIDIVFKMDNTRPVLKSADNGGAAVEPVLTVKSLETATLDLADMYFDADTAINGSIHQIRSVKVATHEFVQLDKYSNVVSSFAADGSSYFNVIPNGAQSIGKSFVDGALESGMLAAEAYSTGFEDWYITGGASNTAFIQYSFSGSTLTINGLRATHDMYKSDRTGGSVLTAIAPNASGDDFTAYNTTYGTGRAVRNAGHFYILINVIDRNDPSDEGIWLPLGIVVTNSAPTELSTERDGTGASAMPTANGAPGQSFYFTPMGVTVANDDGTRSTLPIGYYELNSNFIQTGLNPLASDADNFYTPDMLAGDFAKINELLSIKNIDSIQSSVPGNADGEYFVVEPLDVYVPVSYFGGRIDQPAGSTVTITRNNVQIECVVIQGIKITLNSWTHNRYLFAKAVIGDICDTTDSQSRVTVNIAVNVSNDAPVQFSKDTESSKVAQLNYTYMGKEVSSVYGESGGLPTITYSVPVGSTIFVTPYDLITDVNMTNSGVGYPQYGFTLNGLSGRFNSSTGVYTVLEKGNADIITEGIAIDGNTARVNGGYDYSSDDYLTALKGMLATLQTKRTFTDLAVDNMYATPRETQQLSTNVDRLYFARSSDGSNLDGYTFDPYGSDLGTFEPIAIVGSDYVTPAFGTKLMFGSNESYDIDFLSVYADTRTPSGKPVTIDIKVRDRMGAATSGGVKTIRIAINIVNSTPRVQYPNTIYSLTTNPVPANANHEVTDASEHITVTPSTLVINATASSLGNTERNFLLDNERDAVSFYTQSASPVIVMDKDGNTADSAGNQYLGNYLQVSITSTVLTITALNSTQSVQTLYVVFEATDGVSSDGRNVDHNPCQIIVQVLNANLQVNNGESGFESVAIAQDHSINVWDVDSMNQSDIERERYFASGADMVTALNTLGVPVTNAGGDTAYNPVSTGQIRTVATDTDRLQGIVLSAMKSTVPNNLQYYNVTMPGEGDSFTPDYKSMVPYADIGLSAGNPVAAIVNTIELGKPDYSGEIVASKDILYYVVEKIENGGTVSTVPHMYYASQLRAEGDTTVQDHPEWFFDEQGRWKVTDWAIVVKPNNPTATNVYINVQIRVRDETRFGGDSAGMPTAFSGGNSIAINGFSDLSFYMSIGNLGIVPYTYYNQFGGYYTVADAADDSVNYVPTYDGSGDSLYSYGDDDTDDFEHKYKTIYKGADGTISLISGEALKTRTENTADSTNAGIHSGVKYKVGGAYEYEYVKGTETKYEKAFKYSDTIKISGDKNEYTYVPMSYFAMRPTFTNNLSTSDTISYVSNQYVAYDIVDNSGNPIPYNRGGGDKTAYQDAISISDGTNTWGKGSTTNSNLTDNPYVSFTSFDAYSGSGADMENPGYSAAMKGEYFNNAVSIPTIDKNGKALPYISNTSRNYRTNLVGNGRIMYLSDQASGIQENLFGIGIKKKNTRASAASLTISISVALCSYVDDAAGNTQVLDVDDADSRATVTFKLDIGNSPITLSETGLQVDNNKGYYTTLRMTTSDESRSFVLSRKAPVEAVANTTTILYNDDDVVMNSDDTIDESRSDKAYFFADSVNRLDSWGLGSAMYTRVSKYDDGSFANTASDTNAQKSMRNYFGSRDETTHAFTIYSGGSIDGSFQPNGGLYGDNISGDGRGKEGYSSYFRTSVSADGTRLTITPNAKTTINEKRLANISDKTKEYNRRGLEYDAGAQKGYYPLKVLIYDSHGDGFTVASYIALEIRVYIESSAPILSNSGIVTTGTGAGKVNTLNVALPVDEQYRMPILNYVRSNDLLYSSAKNRLFWESDYTELLNKESKTRGDELSLDTGTYLISPFGDPKYAWTDNANDSDTLLGGGAKLGNGNFGPDGKPVIDKASQPDVLMSLNFVNLKDDGSVNNEDTELKRTSQPNGNELRISVNRRTTVNNADADSERGKVFSFSILFTDSDNHSTEWLTIRVTVTNQAPTIRRSAIDEIFRDIAGDNDAKFEMRVGDSFTVLTTPYDRFIGSDVENGTSASTAASQSTSYTAVTGGQNIDEPSLLKRNAAVSFSTLNTAAVGKDGAHKLHSYVDDPESTRAQHLGYLAVADDDTPWSLRIERVSFYDDTCFSYEEYDKIYDEGKNSGAQHALDVVITASKVCSNLPISITVVDGDGARATLTINVSVVSSKPSAITNEDLNSHDRSEALLSVTENGREVKGVYQTYMVASSVTQTKLTNVTVRDENAVNGSRVVQNVYGIIDLPVNKIAYDPDEADNLNIALYTEGNEYDVFLFNDMPMSKRAATSGGNAVTVYYNDMFDIEVSADFKSFRIICKTYNPDSDWDEIKFYVRDCGNDIVDNAIPIVIRVCTLYSSMKNERQSTTDSFAWGANPVIKEAYVNTVNVKSYDDYSGVSLDVSDMDEEERAQIVGVQSTYQFLRYYDAPVSIDNTASDEYRLRDPDVELSTFNRNYDVKVYALMDVDADDGRIYNSKSLLDASAMFNVANARTGRYWYLKEDVDVRNYLVAGARSSGSHYTNINNSLAMYLQQYFTFELGNDGVSLSFRPVTANINIKVLFYVQVEKTIGNMRTITDANASVKTGTLFYVNVNDSAPIVNSDVQALSFAGRIGESYSFPIFDESDPYASMFNDSDAGDMVTINGFTASGNLTEDYNNALADADCDWQGRDGVSRAISIEINNTDTNDTANNIPAHSLKITILRRIDKKAEDGSYLEEVTFPVKVRGYDRMNRYADAVLYVTVRNSDFDMNQTKLDNDSQHFDVLGAGYAVSRGEADRTYVIDSYIALDSNPINVDLVVGGWLSDPDYTSMAADTESFRLIRPRADSDANASKYLLDEPLNVYAEGEESPVAVLTPVFGNNGANVDAYHFAGFTISSGESVRRGITGTAYMRILDRSSNENRSDTGIVITVNVTTLNAAPTVNIGKDETEQVIIGSNTANGDPIRIDVADYITDRNGDPIRIVGIQPLNPESIHCTTETDNGENIIRVEVLDGTDERICTLTPRMGYYGKQAVQISVADGDLSTDISARMTSFTITITSVYDFGQISGLNTVSAIRSLPTTVTPELLIPDVVDTYDKNATPGGKGSSRSSALRSADGDNMFNPGNDYVITALTPNAPNIDVRKDGNDNWQFTCPREMDNLEFTATFVRAIDVGKEGAQTFTKNFRATVGKNTAPTLNDNFRRDGGFTFTTRDGEYGLNQNGTVTITTGMLFSDIDIESGDRLVFDPSVTEVVSGTMCSVTFSEDNTIMYLTFNMRGETDITVGVKDLTGETVRATFTIKNIDRPEPEFFDMIKISYETYPFIWLGVGIGVLVLIVFIILLVILLKRRKRKQEELEAILLSEMELEEQMLRLSGGPGTAPYQSYGYLPPTVKVQNDAGFMLGSGNTAPTNDAVGLLGQSDGSSGTGGDGMPDGSDM